MNGYTDTHSIADAVHMPQERVRHLLQLTEESVPIDVPSDAAGIAGLPEALVDERQPDAIEALTDEELDRRLVGWL